VPPLVRRYVKTSFLFLLLGLGLGAWVQVTQLLGGHYPPRLHVTAHAHVLLVGFVLMLIMGVATWMFPRPARGDRRYRPELAEAVYWLLTAATAARAVGELAAGLTGAPGWRWLLTVGGLGQLAGGILFVVNMWPRVRMPQATGLETGPRG
jgi:heme/copper-type cytochrome/quinol oxidase subunit 1